MKKTIFTLAGVFVLVSALQSVRVAPSPDEKRVEPETETRSPETLRSGVLRELRSISETAPAQPERIDAEVQRLQAEIRAGMFHERLNSGVASADERRMFEALTTRLTALRARLLEQDILKIQGEVDGLVASIERGEDEDEIR